jgi:hypothetical protein
MSFQDGERVRRDARLSVQFWLEQLPLSFAQSPTERPIDKPIKYYEVLS